MEYRPNDCAMEVGETRVARFVNAAVVGSSAIDGNPVVTCSSGISAGEPEVLGATVAVPVTAIAAGKSWVKIAIPLASGEALVGVVFVAVKDSTCATSRGYH